MAPQRPVRKSKHQAQLNREAVEAQLAATTAPDQRRRLQVLLHMAAGTPLADVAALTGYRPRSIRQIVQRYVELGAPSVVDRRALAPGALPLLSAHQQLELRQAIQHAPPDGGEWTGAKVARWMTAKTGRPVCRQRGCEYLQRLTASTGREGDARTGEQ